MRFQNVLSLSAQEFNIFAALGRGMRQHEIANRKSQKLSINTVDTHLKRARIKLGLRNNTALAVFASAYLESGLIRTRNIPAVWKYKFA